MFKRRRKRSIGERVVTLIWPRMGWRRTGAYYAIRIKRLPGTPYSIGCGFALGAAVSFTPFIGFHFILAAVFAYLMRGNIIAAAIGTAVGNPWTFPFIWAAIYWLGGKILGYERGVELPQELTMDYIFNDPINVLLPMAVGGLPFAVAVWWLIYIPAHRMVDNYQTLRRQKRMQRRAVLEEQRQRAGTGGDDDNVTKSAHLQVEVDVDVVVSRDDETMEEIGEEMAKTLNELGKTVEEKG